MKEELNEVVLEEYNESEIETTHQPTKTRAVNLDDLNDVPDSEKFFKITSDTTIAKDMTLTISDVKINQPQRLDKNGKDLVHTNSKGVNYYKGRVEIRFLETIGGLKIRDFISGVFWNVNRDTNELKELPTISKVADLEDKFGSDLGKIRTLYCQFKKADPKNISDVQFLKGMKGLKVTVEKETGKNPLTDQKYVRLKITGFVN